MSQFAITLSYFDNAIGPRSILCVPWGDSKPTLVSQFFDFHISDDFFTHIFGGVVSFNRLFTISNENSRGGINTFMLTTVIPFSVLQHNEIFLRYYNSFAQLLDDWVNQFKNAFYPSHFGDIIMDGCLQFDEQKAKPLIALMDEFLNELEYIMASFSQMNLDFPK